MRDRGFFGREKGRDRERERMNGTQVARRVSVMRGGGVMVLGKIGYCKYEWLFCLEVESFIGKNVEKC